MEINLKNLHQDFLHYLEIEKGRSMKTVENYDRYLRRFLAFGKYKLPSEITDDAVRSFRIFLNRQKGREYGGVSETLKKRTQNYYLIALRSFLSYLARRSVLSLPPERIDLAKVGDRSIDLISTDELSRLLSAPKGDSLKILRDRAILELLFSTGLRVSELTSLPRELDLRRDEISVRGKGDKVRVVFLSEESKSAVRAYLNKRTDSDDALFVELGHGASSRESSRLTTRSIQRMVAKYALEAGISRRVTPHIIRHSFATDLLRNGADIRSVQALLGHADISTTQIYTHVTDQHLRDVHKKFHRR